MQSRTRSGSFPGTSLAVWGVIGSLAMAAPAHAALPSGEYRLQYGDAVTIQVVGKPDLAIVAQPIRPDGNISLPLVQEVPVAGKTVAQVTAMLNAAYKPFVTTPHVTVNVARFRPTRVTVLGEVARPGNLEFQEPPRLVDALAAAGGLTDRAARDRIRVKAPDDQMRVFDLDAVLAGSASMPVLSENVTVEVAEVWYPDLYRFVPIAASLITAAAVLLRN